MKVFEELRKAGIDSHDIEQLEKFYGEERFIRGRDGFIAVEDEDFEELDENEFDSEKDDFISQIEKSMKNNFKGTVAGIIMVGIPAIGILYWLISSGLL